MDRRIFFAVLACAASVAFAANTVSSMFLWDGSTDTEGRVITGSPEETSGYWYYYNDENEQGTSSVRYPPEFDINIYYGSIFDLLIEEYGGIKVTVNLGEGSETPYVGIGFNVWNEEQDGADISAWGGICLEYSSELSFSVELAVENDATITQYNNFKASAAKSKEPNLVNLSWDRFRQDSGWGNQVDRDSVLAKTAAIKLRFADKAGTTGDFFLSKIGSFGMCGTCCGDPSIVANLEAGAKVNVSISGRMVNFAGVSPIAKVSVMGLQGQTVKTATAAGAMDLSALPAGIYMLRVQGGGIDHMQKIILK
jgi:hypothetical protein